MAAAVLLLPTLVLGTLISHSSPLEARRRRRQSYFHRPAHYT
jgi:hypothetical protein